jgi:hypothetical protein
VPSQKPQDDRLACRADLGVRVVLISTILRMSKRDERPIHGQDEALVTGDYAPHSIVQ